MAIDENTLYLIREYLQTTANHYREQAAAAENLRRAPRATVEAMQEMAVEYRRREKEIEALTAEIDIELYRTRRKTTPRKTKGA